MFTRSLHRGLAALALACALVPQPAVAERAPPRAPGAAAAREAADEAAGARIIVRFKAQASLMRALQAGAAASRGPQLAATLARRLGLGPGLRNGRVVDAHSQVLLGPRGQRSAALAAQLAADPEVEFAVPDRRRRALAVPADPLFGADAGRSPAAGQWYLRAPDAVMVSAINAAAAWNVSTGSAAIVVADLDTGVRFDHPDLAAKLHPGYDFIDDLPTANDGNPPDGDASDPGDWTTFNECGDGGDAAPSSWHGTQTSGLIAAQTGNGVGMAGAGYNVMLLPVRVLGKCGGWDSDIIAGMLWAGGVSGSPTANPHPARVLNMSLGGEGSCTAAYADAVRRLGAAGVVVVAAAGNSNGLAVDVPANCPGVVAVAGVRHAGTKVGYSAVGPEVALAAPAGNCVNDFGECLYPILTTTNSGRAGPGSNTYSDGFDASYGTSFAAPLVAGTAALMLSANPALTPAQLKSLLASTARPFPTTSIDPTVPRCQAPSGAEQIECFCTTTTCGAGMLDAGAAVRAAAGLGDVDRVFNWAEVAYPQYFNERGTPGVFAPYTYRYYPGTGNYLSTAAGRVVVHNGRDWNFLDVGALADFLALAAAAGY